MGSDLDFGREVGAVHDAMSEICDSPLNLNILAVALADSLSQGKSREQLERLSKFLQILQTALKAYM